MRRRVCERNQDEGTSSDSKRVPGMLYFRSLAPSPSAEEEDFTSVEQDDIVHGGPARARSARTSGRSGTIEAS